MSSSRRRPLVLLAALMMALSGCSHEAKFPLRLENQTDHPVELHVAFSRDNETVWQRTYDLPPHSPREKATTIVLPTAEYTLRVTAGNLSAERTENFDGSEEWLHVTVREQEIDLSIVVL